MDAVILQIQQIVSRFPVERVILFGSRARNAHHERSDYDIAIFYQELDEHTQTEIYFELENIETLKKIDLVWIGKNKQPNEQLLRSILSGGITIYERSIELKFQKALDRLREAVATMQELPENRIIQDGLIQRFEFTYELAWKTAKAKLEEQGFAEALTPKAVMKELYALKWIEHESVWLDMVKDRNLTSHVYDEQLADEITARIINQYLPAFQALYEKFYADLQ